jgi:hypothetical protein
MDRIWKKRFRRFGHFVLWCLAFPFGYNAGRKWTGTVRGWQEASRIHQSHVAPPDIDMSKKKRDSLDRHLVHLKLASKVGFQDRGVIPMNLEIKAAVIIDVTFLDELNLNLTYKMDKSEKLAAGVTAVVIGGAAAVVMASKDKVEWSQEDMLAAFEKPRSNETFKILKAEGEDSYIMRFVHGQMAGIAGPYSSEEIQEAIQVRDSSSRISIPVPQHTPSRGAEKSHSR